MAKDRDNSERIKLGFRRLKQGISNFREGLEHDFEKEKEALVADIAEVKKTIAQLENDLKM